MLNKGGNLIAGKQFTDLTKKSTLKDSDIIAVHDGNGLKQSNMADVTSYMSDKFSNPNLLINPDFKINQRGQSEYAYETSGATKYAVDRWRAMALNIKTAKGGILLSADNSGDEGGYFSQVLEDAVEGDTTLSFKVSAVVGSISFNNLDDKNNGGVLMVSSDGIYTIKGNNTIKAIAHLPKGSSCKIEWMKLEQGSIATPFVATNQTDEMLKCQRFTHVISMDSLIGTAMNNKVYAKVLSPIKEGATFTKMKNNMTAVIDGVVKSLTFQEASISEQGSYLLTFSLENETNAIWKPCTMANFTILLDAELY